MVETHRKFDGGCPESAVRLLLFGHALIADNVRDGTVIRASLHGGEISIGWDNPWRRTTAKRGAATS